MRAFRRRRRVVAPVLERFVAIEGECGRGGLDVGVLLRGQRGAGGACVGVLLRLDRRLLCDGLARPLLLCHPGAPCASGPTWCARGPCTPHHEARTAELAWAYFSTSSRRSSSPSRLRITTRLPLASSAWRGFIFVTFSVIGSIFFAMSSSVAMLGYVTTRYRSASFGLCACAEYTR